MPKPTTKRWSREEHVLAFNLYCKIPFGTIHMRNPKIIELAELLGRSVGAVSYKLANFDRGLMTVTADFKVQISDTLEPISKADEEPLDWLRRFDGVPLTLPKKFPPDGALLASHRKRWNG